MHTKASIAVAAMLLASVSACKKPEPAPEAAASSAADAGAAAPSAAATWTPALPSPGTYEVSNADGTPWGKTVINADGSYSDTPVKGLTVSGLVKLIDGKVCFDPSGKAKGPECYTQTVPAADGSFDATDSKGVVQHIKPASK